MADKLRGLHAPVVAVSPIVGGLALKGPAAKIMAELGVEVSPVAVAPSDWTDPPRRLRAGSDPTPPAPPTWPHCRCDPLVTGTIMGDHASKMRLAQNVLQFAAALAQTTAAAEDQ